MHIFLLMHDGPVLKGLSTNKMNNFLHNTYHVFRIDHICKQSLLINDTEVNRNVWESGIFFQRNFKLSFPLVLAGALSVMMDTSLRAGALISRRPLSKYDFMSSLPVKRYCFQQLLLNISIAGDDQIKKK